MRGPQPSQIAGHYGALFDAGTACRRVEDRTFSCRRVEVSWASRVANTAVAGRLTAHVTFLANSSGSEDRYSPSQGAADTRSERRQAVTVATDFQSAIAARRCRRMPEAERCDRGGTKWLRTAEKIGTKRWKPAHDRKPWIIRSRFRIGTWEFSARLFRPLWERCSTSGMTVRLAAPYDRNLSVMRRLGR